MGFAIGLNCFLGFPYNYYLTEEAARTVAKNKEEEQLVTAVILPKMIVGSVTAVTIVSVLVAGILSGLL